MKRLLFKLMYVARRLLFHTRLGKTQFVARVYSVVFEAAAPDLTKPVLFRGTSFYVDPSDRSCVPSMVGGYFEQRELDIFERLITGASVFFDVGANIGIYSVIGCHRAPNLTAYAFEPVSENQEILRRNIAAHGFERRILVQPVAVSVETGTGTIHLYHSGTHSLENDSGSDTRQIDTVSLDEFSAEHRVAPDIMKIDVEGHEAAVIDGALKMLEAHTPTLFIEYIPAAQRDVEGLVDRLRSLFRVCFVVDEITQSVTEINMSQLDRRKGYNLILTTSDLHAAEIRRFVTA